jgi:hypothetical protein
MVEIIVGVVAGVLTSALLHVCKVLWDKKITPFLAEIRYQGVRVDGAWGGRSEDSVANIHSEAHLFLEQSAHKLAGSFNFTFKSPQKTFSLDFKVDGYMWEGYLTLNFLPKDRRVTSYATALVKLHGGGNALVGQFCFRNVDTESVTSVAMALSRLDASIPGSLMKAPVVPLPSATTPAAQAIPPELETPTPS